MDRFNEDVEKAKNAEEEKQAAAIRGELGEIEYRAAVKKRRLALQAKERNAHEDTEEEKTGDARKMSELRTYIENINEGRRTDAAEWRGKLAKALMKIAEQKMKINGLESQLAILTTRPKD